MNFTRKPCCRIFGKQPNTMANPADRLPQNVPGPYYVDSQCIDCDLCRETAPMIFARHEETGFSFVHRQPMTPEEIALATEAIEGCPVEAIGRDGEAAT
jgi:ferredoxin